MPGGAGLLGDTALSICQSITKEVSVIWMSLEKLEDVAEGVRSDLTPTPSTPTPAPGTHHFLLLLVLWVTKVPTFLSTRWILVADLRAARTSSH